MGRSDSFLPASRLLSLLAVAAQIAAHSAAAQPQNQAAVQPAGQYEVAVIKPSKPGAVVQDARVSFPPGRLEALNITLNEILQTLNGYIGRVEGGPKWTQSDRYDIVAKADGDIVGSQRRQAILALLVERFKLAIHQEAREETGSALAVGKKPPDLAAAKDGEETRVTSDAHKAVFQAVNMARFVNYLHNMWHTNVVDQTGLMGKFDFSINMDAAKDLSVQNFSPDTQPTFPDLVRTAVEQLGFSVRPVKVTVDVTVIDRAERPNEN